MQLAMALLLSIGCSPAKPAFHSSSADSLLRLELPSHPTFCRHAAPPYRPLVVCSSTSRQRCRIPKLSSFHPSLYALAALAVNLCHAASSFAVCFGNLVWWRRLWLQAVKNAIDHGWQADVKELVARRGGRAGDAQVLGPNWSEGLGRTCLGKALEWCSSQEETHAAGSSPMQQGGLGMALLSTTAMAKDHINPVLATLSANPTFMSGLLAWAIAQVLKFFTTFFVEKRWDFKMLLGSGGMPSSHSALCVALTTSVALSHGISDALFPVCLGFSLIVMYDATGVRRHAGMQAEVLNLIVEDLFEGHPISEKKLKELLGHTPLQVFAGACLGMMVGYLCSQGYPVAHGNGI